MYSGYACNRIEVTLPIELKGNKNIPVHIHNSYTWWDGLYTTKNVGHEETIILEPKPDFNVETVSKNYYYERDEVAKVKVNVTNNRDEDTDIWLGTTFKGPEGNEYDIPLKHSNIPKDKTKSFDINWRIPSTAAAGQYEIAVNCWKSGAQTEKYTDNLEWQSIFYVPNLDIVTPTTSRPAIVGDPSHPVEFFLKLDTGLKDMTSCYLANAFDIEIGGKEANFQLYNIDRENNYYFKVTPPTQASEGNYDLEVSMDAGDISDTEIEPNAVTYSTGGNADVVEVIDRSGSMSGRKIDDAKNAANLFVDKMTNGDYIGVCSYSSGSSVNYPLTEITSSAIKQNAKNSINGIAAGGMTSIGAGLQSAYSQLVSSGDPGHPWTIILMTDGHHNTAPDPDSILPDLKTNNIKVYTVGLGSNADANLLTHIAEETGGQYYFSPSEKELVAIYNTISGQVKAESILKTMDGAVQKGKKEVETVHVDPSLDVVTFTVTWPSGTIDTVLTQPDGSVVDPADAGVSHTKGSNHEIYTIDDPNAGSWQLELTTPLSDPPYTVTVTGTTNVTFDMFTDKNSYATGEPIQVITTLSDNGAAVTGATVTANITRPDTSTTSMRLYDDGMHGDMAADDGVYANYYTDTGATGSYVINGQATGAVGPDTFIREATKSVTVSGTSSGGLSIAPASWETDTIHNGEYALKSFTVHSSSPNDETVSLSATDFVNESKQIGPDNAFFVPQTFTVPAGGDKTIFAVVSIPDNARTGNYTGHILLQSSANSLSIPTTLCVEQLKTDLHIEMQDSPSRVKPGDNLTYTIDITNTGNIPAQTVSIRETYDTNFVPLTFSPAPDAGNTTWMFDSIAPGETKTIQITGMVADNSQSFLRNVVTYSSADTDLGRVVEHTEVIYAQPGLRIEDPAMAEAGDAIRCRLTYYNGGGLNMTNTSLRFHTPHASVQEQYSYGTQYNSSDSTADSIWNIGTLKAHSSEVIECWLQIDTPLDNNTILPFRAELVSDQASKQAITNMTVHSSPYLTTDIEDTPDPINEGQNVTYTMTVHNTGNMNATNLTVTHAFDEIMLHIVDSDGGDNNGDALIWDVDKLAVGETREYIVTATADDVQSETPATNTIEVDCEQNVSACCSESTTICPVLSPPDLHVSPVAPTITEANNIQYLVEVANTGQQEATGLTITLTYDETQITIMGCDGGTNTGGRVTWNLTELAGGTTTAFTVDAAVNDASSDIAISAEATCNNGVGDVNETTTAVVCQPPATTVDFHGYASEEIFLGGIYTLYNIRPNTSLTLSSTDAPPADAAGVDATMYRVWRWDSSNSRWVRLVDWKEYENKAITLATLGETNGYPQSGKYCIDFYSVDKAGNQEPIQWMDIYVSEPATGEEDTAPAEGISSMERSIPGFQLFILLGAAATIFLLIRKKKQG